MPLRVLESDLSHWVDPAVAFGALSAGAEAAFWLDCGPDATQGVSAVGVGTDVIDDVSHSPLLDRMAERLRRFAVPSDATAAGFRLGWVGWFAYEFGGETVPGLALPEAAEPRARFMWVDRAVTFDHARKRVTLLALGERWEGELELWRSAVTARLAEHRLAGHSGTSQPPSTGAFGRSSAAVEWRDTPESYLAKIASCQRAIEAGSAYLLCLTTQARVTGCFDPLETYLAVRRSSPSPHGGLIRFADAALLSASPEQFLRVDADRTVTTRPIKGTRPRSVDASTDRAFASELGESVKERAENLMIVDLMRNDLARVSEIGTVAVPGFLEVESHPHVHQLVSTITGVLRPDLGPLDAVAACFPAGSMTGAPKREAIRILTEVEGAERGVYSGAFGYLSVDGTLDLAMVIRSIVITGTAATVGAGGGITALSEPTAEWEEVQLKAEALLGVLLGGSGELSDARHDGPHRVLL